MHAQERCEIMKKIAAMLATTVLAVSLYINAFAVVGGPAPGSTDMAITGASSSAQGDTSQGDGQGGASTQGASSQQASSQSDASQSGASQPASSQGDASQQTSSQDDRSGASQPQEPKPYSGSYIKSSDVIAVQQLNGDVNVVNTLKFNMQQGDKFVFEIPTELKLKKDTGKGEKYLTYNALVEEINVNGCSFSKTAGAKAVEIVLELPAGEQAVEISYIYSIGDDRVAGYDELLFYINGGGYSLPCDAQNFSFTLPKSVDMAGAVAYLKAGDVKMDGDVAIGIVGTTMRNKTPVKPQNFVLALSLRLPEGYYVGVRKFDLLYSYIAFGLTLLAAFVCIALFGRRKLKNAKGTVLEEMYPPKNITSAEVNKIMYSAAEDRDALSLVVWLAQAGYISIKNSDTGVQYTKIKSADGMPLYAKMFFDTLFGDETTVGVAALESKNMVRMLRGEFYNELEREFKGKRKLWRIRAFLWPLTVLFATAMVYFGIPQFELFTYIYLGLFAGGALAGGALIAATLAGKKAVQKIMLFILAAALLAVAGFGAYKLLGATFTPALACYIAAVAVLAAIVADAEVVVSTKYRRIMRAGLNGLLKFIKKPDKLQLKNELAANKNYFYNILPYAYAFDYCDRWAKAFEGVEQEDPAWFSDEQGRKYGVGTIARIICAPLDVAAKHLGAHSQVTDEALLAHDAAHTTTDFAPPVPQVQPAPEKLKAPDTATPAPAPEKLKAADDATPAPAAEKPKAPDTATAAAPHAADDVHAAKDGILDVEEDAVVAAEAPKDETANGVEADGTKTYNAADTAQKPDVADEKNAPTDADADKRADSTLADTDGDAKDGGQNAD